MQKTRKNNHKSIVVQLLKFSNILKLFHWNTNSYSLHVSSDKFFNDLSENIDKLVEILLKDSRLNCFQSSISIGFCNNKLFFSKLSEFKNIILSLRKQTYLSNICDDIINDIDHFTYFASFKNWTPFFFYFSLYSCLSKWMLNLFLISPKALLS